MSRHKCSVLTLLREKDDWIWLLSLHLILSAVRDSQNQSEAFICSLKYKCLCASFINAHVHKACSIMGLCLQWTQRDFRTESPSPDRRWEERFQKSCRQGWNNKHAELGEMWISSKKTQTHQEEERTQTNPDNRKKCKPQTAFIMHICDVHHRYHEHVLKQT